MITINMNKGLEGIGGDYNQTDNPFQSLSIPNNYF